MNEFWLLFRRQHHVGRVPRGAGALNCCLALPLFLKFHIWQPTPLLWVSVFLTVRWKECLFLQLEQIFEFSNIFFLSLKERGWQEAGYATGTLGWALLISEIQISCLSVFRPGEIMAAVTKTRWALRFYLKHLSKVHWRLRCVFGGDKRKQGHKREATTCPVFSGRS